MAGLGRSVNRVRPFKVRRTWCHNTRPESIPSVLQAHAKHHVRVLGCGAQAGTFHVCVLPQTYQTDICPANPNQRRPSEQRVDFRKGSSRCASLQHIHDCDGAQAETSQHRPSILNSDLQTSRPNEFLVGSPTTIMSCRQPICSADCCAKRLWQAHGSSSGTAGLHKWLVGSRQRGRV